MKTVNELNVIAEDIRKTLFQTISHAGAGHFGGNMSMVDLATALYYGEMNVDPQAPKMPERDRLVMSKGHAGPILYTVLAKLGFMSEDELDTLDCPGSKLQKHATAGKVPGIDISTGSLGQGLSMAVGMALAVRASKLPSRIYAILGDGECNEGQIWEAAMTAAKYQLDNLLVIVDRNKLQIDGTTEDVMPLEPFPEKWASFGFAVEVIDGHNMEEIMDSLKKAKENKGRPTVIIANTIKGYGISYMANNVNWHASGITKEQIAQGFAELEARP